MKMLNDYKSSLMLIVVASMIIMGSKSAKADFTFGEPTNLGSPINTSSNEGTLCLSADGLEMYISSNRPGTYGIGDIWVSRRSSINDSWTEPINLGQVVNSQFPDTVEYISPDGLELYFDALDRPGGRGGWDIWMTKRDDVNEHWSTPVNMDVPFNTTSDDWRACISPDNLKFYFVSTRPGGHGGADIWAAERTTTEEPWAEPVNLGPPVNSSADDSGPTFSCDGRVFFFQSTRSGGHGGFDLWMTVCRTKDDDCNTPKNLGATINTSSDEILPAISGDGSILYFCSPRPGGQGAWDIYQASLEPIVDFNGDGIVDIDDLVIMIENWGTSESLCDIAPQPWGNGIVDRKDLELFMSHWGENYILKAHWKLDEAEGLIAYDSSGNSYDANVIGDPNWQPDGGMVNGALEFDGVNDYVSTPFVINPATGSFSVFAWIKGGLPGQVILSQVDGANWLSANISDGSLMTELKGGGRSGSILVSQTIITDDNWHRIGLTWDGVNRILYVDDIVAAQDTQANLISAEGGLYIGSGNGLHADTYFHGLIDDVQIYNQAITP